MRIKAKIQSLFNDLSNDPEVQLLTFCTFPPADKKTINDIEAKHQLKLPKELVEFYEETNGFQVAWTTKDDPNVKSTDFQSVTTPLDWNWPMEGYRNLKGLINIVPIEKIFLTFKVEFPFLEFASESNFKISWNGQLVTINDFLNRVYPLDVFDNYYTVNIYVEDAGFSLLLGEDGNRMFSDYIYEPAFLPDYFNFLFSSKGKVDDRKSFFLKEYNDQID